MIDLHYWPTPNGWKITIALEEMGLEYRIVPVDIGRGDQFDPAFGRVSPNGRIPAIVDHAPPDGGGPFALFESGEILLYLAEKSRRFLPQGFRERHETLAWLFWQVGGLGPMLGQAHHFRRFAPERVPYAIGRYTREAARLYDVLDRRLDGREFLAGEYSIADMAVWPWIVLHRMHGQELPDFPNVARWHEAVGSRPAVTRGHRAGADLRGGLRSNADGREIDMDETARAVLFRMPS